MNEDQFGTKEQRIAVREAVEALAAFTRRLDLCKELGIACALEQRTEGPWHYIAHFTKTTLILPSSSDDL